MTNQPPQKFPGNTARKSALPWDRYARITIFCGRCSIYSPPLHLSTTVFQEKNTYGNCTRKCRFDESAPVYTLYILKYSKFKPI
jgi:hypothetical protein